MLALVQRNFLLYFRNKSGVFFSLLGALISFILYIIFLQKNLADSWSQLSGSTGLLNNWLMSGTLAVTAITTSLAGLTQMVKDREQAVDQDLFLTDLGKWGLQFSYLVSGSLISLVMQILMFGVMSLYFKEVPVWSSLPEVLGIMLLSSLLSTLVNAVLIFRFRSVDSLGKFATVVGTASGFLVGTYVPLGVLPDFAQLLMKCTPATYVASLYRQVLMKDQLSGTFKGQGQLFTEFEEKMGVRLVWQELLTKEATYFIVLGGILLVGLVWFGLVKSSGKRK